MDIVSNYQIDDNYTFIYRSYPAEMNLYEEEKNYTVKTR